MNLKKWKKRISLSIVRILRARWETKSRKQWTVIRTSTAPATPTPPLLSSSRFRRKQREREREIDRYIYIYTWSFTFFQLVLPLFLDLSSRSVESLLPDAWSFCIHASCYWSFCYGAFRSRFQTIKASSSERRQAPNVELFQASLSRSWEAREAVRSHALKFRLLRVTSSFWWSFVFLSSFGSSHGRLARSVRSSTLLINGVFT